MAMWNDYEKIARRLDRIANAFERIANALETANIIEADHNTELQTETEIAKAIVHKMIDDAVIAEDAYPDLRQKMHDAVDEYEPQTERSE